jgi:hypothetical protein
MMCCLLPLPVSFTRTDNNGCGLRLPVFVSIMFGERPIVILARVFCATAAAYGCDHLQVLNDMRSTDEFTSLLVLENGLDGAGVGVVGCAAEVSSLDAQSQ